MSDRPRRAAAKRAASRKPAGKVIGKVIGKVAGRTGGKLSGKAARKTAAPAAKALAAKALVAKAPPLKIDLIVEDAGWLKALALPDEASLARRLRAAARRAVAVALADRWRGSAVGLDCCLVLGSDARVRGLNRDYRGKDKPTNVLSFAALDGGRPPRNQPWSLGDVILALGTCRKEARAQGKSLEQHLLHLVIHGVLHLLGYDHEADAEAERMEGLEIAALKRLGIDNPYLTM